METMQISQANPDRALRRGLGLRLALCVALAFPAMASAQVPAPAATPAAPRPPGQLPILGKVPDPTYTPIAVVVKSPDGAYSERWQWAPGGAGKVEYCRLEGPAQTARCAVADNPQQGDHMPASQATPVISAVQTGMAWIATGGTTYFCKNTTYNKEAPLEVTCVDAANHKLLRAQPVSVLAMANRAARFVFPTTRAFCRHLFPAPDGSPSQTYLNCDPM